MKRGSKLSVAVIGCGLIGSRRADIAAKHPNTKLSWVVDVRKSAAQTLAHRHRSQWSMDWKAVVQRKDVDVVIVSTINRHLAPMVLASLKAGKHVLMEKPMGIHSGEAGALVHEARQKRRLLKIGFNHRYHPALQDLKKLLDKGVIGKPFLIRAVYGHGGRPGYDKEWRTRPSLSGGGELLDQGIHLIDLILWLFGPPSRVRGVLPRWVWAKKRVEDNALVQMEWKDGKAAQFHASWTQWKNRFEFQVYGEKGALEASGLGGSYGRERMTIFKRSISGGAPKTTEKIYPLQDLSWKKEWADFVQAIQKGKKCPGMAEEGFAVMRVIDLLYGLVQPIRR